MENKQPKDSRKWNITINNPEKHGYTIESVIKSLETWEGVQYWCFGSEIGVNEHTPHYHFAIYVPNKKLFTTVKNRFPESHIEECKGTMQENRDYCWKEGKHKDSEAGTMHDYANNKEGGEMPKEVGRGTRTDLHQLYDMIKDGMSDYQIMEACPQYMKQFDKIDKVRQTIRYEQYADCWRNLHVVYIWGSTGAGKTRYVMEEFGYRNVYRVTDYLHPFDSYKGQDVVVFEEFRSDIKLGDMLNYLDGYPVELSARYNNKYACFTKVFIISNIDIRDQYPNKQEAEPESYRAFLRRINEVWFTTGKGFEKYKTEEYMKNEWRHITNSPFEEEKGA